MKIINSETFGLVVLMLILGIIFFCGLLLRDCDLGGF